MYLTGGTIDGREAAGVSLAPSAPDPPDYKEVIYPLDPGSVEIIGDIRADTYTNLTIRDTGDSIIFIISGIEAANVAEFDIMVDDPETPTYINVTGGSGFYTEEGDLFLVFGKSQDPQPNLSGLFWGDYGQGYISFDGEVPDELICTLSYNANGGQGGIPTQDDGYRYIVSSADSLVRLGYTFVSWNTAPDGSGDTWQPGQEITLESNMTLYAIWQRDFIVSSIGRYRRLWLENRLGEIYDMTDIAGSAFLEGIAGLGAVSTLEIVPLNGAELVTADSWEMVDATGNLYFKLGLGIGDPYQEYRRFMSFCALLPLRLCYQTPDLSEGDYYRRQCRILSIDKTEIDQESNTLVCPITIHPLELWRGLTEDIDEVEAEESEGGKLYPLDRPYIYARNSHSFIALSCFGDIATPLAVTIDGSTDNPQWSLYDSSNTLYGRARIVGTYDAIEVNSDPLNQYIKLLVGDAYVPNAFARQDVTVGVPGVVQATFLYLKPGENYLTLQLGDGFDGKITVRRPRLYVSV
jgi:hypothetical protein